MEGLPGLYTLNAEPPLGRSVLGGAIVTANGGIQVDMGKVRYALDPHSHVRADYTFVSHAHIDHTHAPS